MKIIKVLIVTGALSLLALGLSGCGDDTPTPIEKGVGEVHKADGNVKDLNKLTEESEDAIKEAGK